MADFRDCGDLAVLGLEHREQAGFARQPRQPDGIATRRAPAQRAGHEHLQIARAVQDHRLFDLGLQIVQIGHGGGGDIGDFMRHGDQRHVLALAELGAGFGAKWLRGGRARGGRRGRRPLHPGVHVAFVVVADVKHIIVALEHAGKAAKADVGGAAIAALRDDPGGGAAPRPPSAPSPSAPPQCPSRPPPHCRTASAATAVATWFRGKAWKTPQGSRSHWRRSAALRRAHRGIDRIARAQGLATALTGAVARGQRIVARLEALHGALVFGQQAVAHGERAGLIKLDRLRHASAFLAVRGALAPMSRSRFSAIGPVRRIAASRARWRLTISQSRSRKVEVLQLVRHRLVQHPHQRGLRDRPPAKASNHRVAAHMDAHQRHPHIGRNDAAKADGKAFLQHHHARTACQRGAHRRQRERAETADRQHADLHALGAHRVDGFLQRADHRAQRHHDGFGVFNAVAAHQPARVAAEHLLELGARFRGCGPAPWSAWHARGSAPP